MDTRHEQPVVYIDPPMTKEQETKPAKTPPVPRGVAIIDINEGNA